MHLFRLLTRLLMSWIAVAILAIPAFGQAGSVAKSKEIPQRLPEVIEPSTAVPRLRSAAEASHLYLGYDKGFLLAADEAIGSRAADANFLMRINSWVQLRHTYFDSDGPNPDQNTFSFERLRLSFGGHVFSPDLQYYFQFDGNSDTQSQLTLLDYYATYDIGHNILCLHADELGIKFGKWKVPFSRSREETARKMQFGERSISNLFFDLDRAIGIGLYSVMEQFTVPMYLETAIFNGFNTGNVATNRTGGLDRNFGWSARVFSDVIGEFGDDGEPDLKWHDQPALRLGAGTAFTRFHRAGNDAEYSLPTVVDSGDPLARLLPADVTAYDMSMFTVDGHFKWCGLSVIAEYYWRYIARFSGAAVPGLFDRGFNLQTGYFIVPHKLEALARWSRIVGDSGMLGADDQSSDEFGCGWAWYWKGHNAKIINTANYLNGAPLTSNRLDTVAGDVGWLYRTQLQLAF